MQQATPLFGARTTARLRVVVLGVALCVVGLGCDVADPAPHQRIAPGLHLGEASSAVHKYGPHASQLIEVYPRRAGASRGTLVYFHGGSFAFGWAPAVRNESVVMSQRLRGWDVVSVGYRLRGDAPFPAQLHDAAAALRWLKRHGTSKRLDVRRLVTVGTSAGGTLAALMGTVSNTNQHLVKDVPRVTGWASFSGRANFSTPDPGATDLRRHWLADNPHNVHHASYLVWLDAHDPPGYLAHGDHDDVVPVANFHQVRTRSLDGDFFGSIEFDLVDRGADGRFLPLTCRRHDPSACMNLAGFNAWLDNL